MRYLIMLTILILTGCSAHRIPDYKLKIMRYGRRGDLTMYEKQQLHEALRTQEIKNASM